ncbi:hypothetical protein Rxyl_1699 [Rubrobacter xylanophilus DSM 9941]|uniref:Uncharacterized protein n=1 Tax=Rubrobacter xylanophilus (strain DSM 9941 / JCM 11954 / NBRC 16129 / PRD-1) TaxID=266117 RepID=Q1AVB9_RUBXD|nr:hypothetical protein Rxyl_1699 [Rubrobacter xylanophilus DSM 9941]
MPLQTNSEEVEQTPYIPQRNNLSPKGLYQPYLLLRRFLPPRTGDRTPTTALSTNSSDNRALIRQPSICAPHRPPSHPLTLRCFPHLCIQILD